ncbi:MULTISPECIES: hypothetical protein [unclassified Rhizobium]|uniref:hypothetical protein n=1 Tax=unclassified Rhizobium TaxID=2613769 RepID=UPI001ADC6D11|nr:hypothetical protein [Rhizobium sp. 16-488-2b]MBO9178590.1 hypothetical protein [Rhizobium sp. 16-488-2a]
MSLQALWVEVRSIRQVQCVEGEPLCKALRSIILMELDACLFGKSSIGKYYIEDRKKLMPQAVFMGVDILYEQRRADDFYCYPEFLVKLADDQPFRQTRPNHRAGELPLRARCHPELRQQEVGHCASGGQGL